MISSVALTPVVFTINCAKFVPPNCGAYVKWNRGEDIPMKQVMDLILVSCSSIRFILSATAEVLSMDVPVGKNISTENWFRCAIGSNRMGRSQMATAPTTTHTMAITTIVFGNLKQTLRTFL